MRNCRGFSWQRFGNELLMAIDDMQNPREVYDYISSKVPPIDAKDCEISTAPHMRDWEKTCRHERYLFQNVYFDFYFTVAVPVYGNPRSLYISDPEWFELTPRKEPIDAEL